MQIHWILQQNLYVRMFMEIGSSRCRVRDRNGVVAVASYSSLLRDLSLSLPALHSAVALFCVNRLHGGGGATWFIDMEHNLQ